MTTDIETVFTFVAERKLATSMDLREAFGRDWREAIKTLVESGRVLTLLGSSGNVSFMIGPDAAPKTGPQLLTEPVVAAAHPPVPQPTPDLKALMREWEAAQGKTAQIVVLPFGSKTQEQEAHDIGLTVGFGDVEHPCFAHCRSPYDDGTPHRARPDGLY
jgi:hypothetical protein